jgi:flagellum-specific peptidoglycan hydrolase FlgJ
LIDLNKRITAPAKKIGEAIGVPYKFIIAQICLETGYGKSSLASKYFNFGGIKAVGSQPKVDLLTTECKNGVCSKVMQPFAIYPNAEAGLKAQSKIYENRYFKQYLNKTKDPLVYANLLQSGATKYATDPNYVKKIQNILNVI